MTDRERLDAILIIILAVEYRCMALYPMATAVAPRYGQLGPQVTLADEISEHEMRQIRELSFPVAGGKPDA